MATLRKCSLLLALVALTMLSTGVASAQLPAVPPLTLGVITCNATAVPPIVRAEGIAELVGDIVLTCVNIPPPNNDGPAVNTVITNVSVSLNVPITNNIDFGSAGFSDAILVINENNCVDPEETGGSYTCGANNSFQAPQQGFLVTSAGNRLEWNEVNFPIPGASTTPNSPAADCFDGDGSSGRALDTNLCFPFTSTIRITSIRANASATGVPDQALFPSTQIEAFVSITGPTTIPVNNNVFNVAIPLVGLVVNPADRLVGLQCIDQWLMTAIELQEGFATAFKTLGFPTFTPGNTQWESGYPTTDAASNSVFDNVTGQGGNPFNGIGGGATQGTRFLLRLFNVPSGVTVEVANTIFCLAPGNLELRLVTGTDGNGALGSLSTDLSTLVDNELTPSGGALAIVYEVVDSNPFVVEDCDVPLNFHWETDTDVDSPAVGVAQVSATFAPLSTVPSADADAPEPRFIDTSGDPADILVVAKCTTTLLFPFVTNQSGFDTGIAISNTSEDWFGTPRQSGTCTIHYHGVTTGGGLVEPDTQESSSLAAGGQLVFTLSGGNPDQGIERTPEFQGYVIAICQFQYGHGFAFITDGFGGVPALAQGYLALVIPVKPGPDRTPGVPGGLLSVNDGFGNLHSFGEALNH